ncbi:GspE/PulE family protein [Paenibacillus qinlingensis]|uniref:GspE/PulE family protein n=1 Tax=Paenibacillus qinlingensis TaxID=1837343 RepID=UPI0015679668|nr:GspE/PulE family protein [Paenibacillus qinlingensis]NQX59079.1 type II/IV secretion system protein [Paenibacillus qinlingensis]
MRIGELFVMNGLITEDQLEQGLKQQVHTRKKIGEILIDKGLITERQLVEVLEFQLGFPVVNMFETQLDMQTVQLIPETLARKHCVIPIERKNGKIKVAMVDPLNYGAIEEIRMATNMSVQPVIAIRSEVEQAITKNYGMKESVDELMVDLDKIEIKDEESEANDQGSPIVKLVNQIIQSAVQQRASDIHVDPQEKQLIVKYRIDGVLRTEKALPKHMQGVLTARLKIIAKLNIAERRLPQDGRIQMQVDNRRIDIRVSTLPTVHGESIVLRILDQSAGVKKIAELGLSDANLVKFDKMIQKPNGIMLISGPTGSGKTSTLYSALGQLNGDDVKIITVEDPVEYRMNGVTQVQVNSQIGLTFASGLRSILRQDPNIVMVGEVRDAETAEIAVRASLTGHLVLSTIHTNSAVSTISRLVDMGIDSYLIASSLSCIVAQRLVRRVCRECAAQVPAREDEMKLLETHGLLSGTEQQLAGTGTGVVVPMTSPRATDKPVMVTRGKGCGTCNKTGYRGRIAVHELLVVDEPLRSLIVQNRPVSELEQHLMKNGFKNMLYDGLLKIRQGHTTIEEVLKAVADE